MSVRSDVLLWAQRVVARRDATSHQLLEIDERAELPAAQEAFHKIARVAHPDLHRGSLTDEEIELVATAYARVAAAYQELRALRAQTGPMPPLQPDPPLPRTRVLSAHAFALRTRAPATQPLPQRTRAPSVQPLPPPTPPTRAPSTQPLPLRTREPSVQPLPPPTPPTRAPATQPLPPRAASSQPLPPRAGTSQPLPSRAGTSPGVGGSGVLGIRPGGPGANTPGVGGSGVLGIRPGGSGDDAPGAHLATGSSPDAIRASTPSGISHKALLHYRKAELSLRRGELKEAVLQLKLAVASDPQSAFLRTALAEVEAVVGK